MKEFEIKPRIYFDEGSLEYLREVKSKNAFILSDRNRTCWQSWIRWNITWYIRGIRSSPSAAGLPWIQPRL